MLVWVAKSHPKFRELTRLLVAYDGDTTSDASASDITHIIIEDFDVSKWDVDVSRAVAAHPSMVALSCPSSC